MKSDLTGDNLPLPMYHSTAASQVTIQIDENGNFINAEIVAKKESVTIIPVTEESGTRGNGIFPMPLTDKISYIAGDYAKYCSPTKKNDKGEKIPNPKLNEEYRKQYLNQLHEWAEGKYTHPSVKAIYEYVKKGTVITDLVQKGILKLDAESEKLDESKINGTAQEDITIRFIVGTKKTWEDKSLYDSFISYNKTKMKNTQLCYATGEEGPVTYKHPNKILSEASKAKIISSNDEKGFTYRGRFNNVSEAISIGYDFSQKIHNALKWLIKNNEAGFNENSPYNISKKYGSLRMIIWRSGLGYVAEPMCSINDYGEEDEEQSYDSGFVFKEKLKNKIFGNSSEKLSPDEKIMIMVLDATDEKQGRVSIISYSELNVSKYNENVQKWHEGIAWPQFNPSKKKEELDSFSIRDIATYAYGIEYEKEDGTKSVKCKDAVMRDVVSRLLPCVIDGKRIPTDIVNSIVKKASNPQSYDIKSYNFNKVLAIACGLVQKYNIDYYKGDVQNMGYDENNTSRSYLFGCLLAIADYAERKAYSEDDRDTRETNARRNWNAFCNRPAETWKKIEAKLQPYLKKLKGNKEYYLCLIDTIVNKISAENFNNKKLNSDYLLGYHHFRAYIANHNKNNNEKKVED